MPKGFLPYGDTSGDLRTRLGALDKLNRHEQSMQLFYIESVWMIYNVLDDLEKKIGNPSTLFLTTRKKYMDVMKRASEIWDKTYGMSVAQTVMSSVSGFIYRCSPKNKRKRVDTYEGSNKIFKTI